MGSDLVKRGLEFTARRKKWIITLGLVGISGYGVYQIYHLPCVSRERKRMLKLFESIVSIAEMVSDSAETVTLVSRDLKEFLKSDSDEIPKSLNQLSKVARSEEFSGSLARVCEATVVGILRGYKVQSVGGYVGEFNGSSVPEKVMDKLMSTAGTGFASVVVGSFARNLVMGFYAGGGSGKGEISYENGCSDALWGKSSAPKWVGAIYDGKCRVFLGDCIKTFVSAAVAIYLEKTMDVNIYNEMFAGLTNSNHQDKMTDVLVSLCNGAVETLVKTSHQVLTAPKQDSNSGLCDHGSKLLSLENGKVFNPETCFRKNMNEYVDLQSAGWVSSVSSTLAVSSNRKFVLDVTGRMTFETIRSVIEFLFRKICEGLKRNLNVVHDKAVERGFEVATYVGAKSSIILTICLALFLHFLGNARLLMPA